MARLRVCQKCCGCRFEATAQCRFTDPQQAGLVSMPEFMPRPIQNEGSQSYELIHISQCLETAGWTRRSEDKWRLPLEQSERAGNIPTPSVLFYQGVFEAVDFPVEMATGRTAGRTHFCYQITLLYRIPGLDQ